MIYSCFNPQLGLYEYFEDATTHPTNGDLPVPNLAKMAGKVGVPAQDAGRKLPPGAKRAGRGWRARGIIVQCKNASAPKLSGLGQLNGQNVTMVDLIYIAGSFGLAYSYAKMYTKQDPKLAGVASASVAAILIHIRQR